MKFITNRSYQQGTTRYAPNRWDVLMTLLVLSLLSLLAWGAMQMHTPYRLGEAIPITLNPHALPGYALRTVLRMAIALLVSLLFTVTCGTLAARYRVAERIIIPTVDILQSVPVLGFLSISLPAFIVLFPGSMLGPECAAIFAIFTSQAWNMILGFYQSLITVPAQLTEATRMLRLSPWQRFWRLEVPFAMPSLLWNTMISLSASWFFVVAAEAISVANQSITLPGIGSYIAKAILEANRTAIVYAIATMFVVILGYDQIVFRPLLSWADKFRSDALPEEYIPKPWLNRILQRTRLLKRFSRLTTPLADRWLAMFSRPKVRRTTHRPMTYWMQFLPTLLYAGILLAIILGGYSLTQFIFAKLPLSELVHVALLGAVTGFRVMVLIVLCSVIWIPIGVWVGLNPKLTRVVQPIAQFFAAFPANLLYPVVVMLIVKYHLNVEVWTTPLMILGTQWYILFNVIAGASGIPKDLRLATANFGVKKWLWWKRLALPGIYPYFVTGAITAAGGAWNASIIAEYVRWGHTTLKATGLGAYITENTISGDFARQALGISVMCVYVLLINRLVWQPLYRSAEKRYAVTE